MIKGISHQSWLDTAMSFLIPAPMDYNPYSGLLLTHMCLGHLRRDEEALHETQAVALEQSRQ